jgi:DNA-binding XRE family transcriptional regulator
METNEALSGGLIQANGGVAVIEEEHPLPPEPSDYEYAGIFDGDMRFLSCTRCGGLIAADAANIKRHNEMHRSEQFQMAPPETPENFVEGDDLAQLLRDAVKTEMRERGITQVQLSKMAGVSQKHLSQMFTGNAYGSLELWSKIAEVMDRRWAVSLGSGR